MEISGLYPLTLPRIETVLEGYEPQEMQLPAPALDHPMVPLPANSYLKHASRVSPMACSFIGGDALRTRSHTSLIALVVASRAHGV